MLLDVLQRLSSIVKATNDKACPETHDEHKKCFILIYV